MCRRETSTQNYKQYPQSLKFQTTTSTSTGTIGLTTDGRNSLSLVPVVVQVEERGETA